MLVNKSGVSDRLYQKVFDLDNEVHSALPFRPPLLRGAPGGRKSAKTPFPIYRIKLSANDKFAMEMSKNDPECQRCEDCNLGADLCYIIPGQRSSQPVALPTTTFGRCSWRVKIGASTPILTRIQSASRWDKSTAITLDQLAHLLTSQT